MKKRKGRPSKPKTMADFLVLTDSRGSQSGSSCSASTAATLPLTTLPPTASAAAILALTDPPPMASAAATLPLIAPPPMASATGYADPAEENETVKKRKGGPGQW